MNGHRHTGPTGPFRVGFYPRDIIAKKAARKDSSNFAGNFSKSVFCFRKLGGGEGIAPRWSTNYGSRKEAKDNHINSRRKDDLH
jgi:hypothetical protein